MRRNRRAAAQDPVPTAAETRATRRLEGRGEAVPLAFVTTVRGGRRRTEEPTEPGPCRPCAADTGPAGRRPRTRRHQETLGDTPPPRCRIPRVTPHTHVHRVQGHLPHCHLYKFLGRPSLCNPSHPHCSRTPPSLSPNRPRTPPQSTCPRSSDTPMASTSVHNPGPTSPQPAPPKEPKTPPNRFPTCTMGRPPLACPPPESSPGPSLQTLLPPLPPHSAVGDL